MRFSKSIFIAFMFLLCGFGGVANADAWNKKVIFTVDQDFIVPGAQYTDGMTYVPAGRYVIKFLGSAGPQTVAALYDEYEQYLIATAIPHRVSSRHGRYIDAAYDDLIEFESHCTTVRRQQVDRQRTDRQRTGRSCHYELTRWYYPGYDQGWEFSH